MSTAGPARRSVGLTTPAARATIDEFETHCQRGALGGWDCQRGAHITDSNIEGGLHCGARLRVQRRRVVPTVC